MSNYLDHLDLIDANDEQTEVLLQDRETLALASLNAQHIGNLNELDTDDRSSLVNAINSITNRTNYSYFEDFGAVGDGITDDTNAINTALASNKTAFKMLANKTYLVSGNLNIVHSNTHITAEENACVKCADNSYTNMFSVFTVSPLANIENVELDNFTIDGNCQNNIDYGDPDENGNLPKNYGGRVLALINFTSVKRVNIHNMTLINAWNGGIWLSDCTDGVVHDNFVSYCRVHGISIRNNETYSTVEPSNNGIYNNVISHSVVGVEVIFGNYSVIVNDNIITYCSDSEKFPSYAFYGVYPNIYPKDNRFITPSSPNYVSAAQLGDGAGIEATGAYTSVTAPPNTSLVYSGNTCALCQHGLRCEELTNDVTITGNNARQNAHSGIFIFSARKVSIVSNIINYNDYGITIDDYDALPCNINISDNQLSSNTTVGIIMDVDGVNIVGNQFNDNPLGIYSPTQAKNVLISSNSFFDYYAAGSLRAVDIAHMNTSNTRIIGNSFNVDIPVVSATRDSMFIFDNNTNFRTKRYGIANVDSSLTATVVINMPFAPDTGQLKITPLSSGLEPVVTEITALSFTVTTSTEGSFNWFIDFNENA